MEYTKLMTNPLVFVRNNAESSWEKVLNLFNNDKRFLVVAGNIFISTPLKLEINILSGHPSIPLKGTCNNIGYKRNSPRNKIYYTNFDIGYYWSLIPYSTCANKIYP